MDAQTLGKALKHLSVPFLIAFATVAGAQVTSMGTIELTGVTLSVTSGTLELQHVVAQKAYLGGSNSTIVVEDLDVVTKEEGRPEINAQAEEGTIVLGAPKGKAEDRKRAPSQQEILEYGRNFTALAANGDMMLSGTTKPASGHMGDQGSIESKKIIWSDKYDRVIIPEPFKQHGKGGDGTIVDVEGAALSVDRSFTDWTYFTDSNQGGNLVLGGASAPDKDKKQ